MEKTTKKSTQNNVMISILKFSKIQCQFLLAMVLNKTSIFTFVPDAAVRGPSQPMRMQNRAQQQIQMQQFKYQQQGRMAPNQQVPPQQPPQQPQVPQQVAPVS